ncbi:MAG: hypothetical protein MPL62_05810 [Alphaproteobacteria bacterium]|nr:hypothetical protein [Alphaproteobacteria bacterium]
MNLPEVYIRLIPAPGALAAGCRAVLVAARAFKGAAAAAEIRLEGAAFRGRCGKNYKFSLFFRQLNHIITP